MAVAEVADPGRYSGDLRMSAIRFRLQNGGASCGLLGLWIWSLGLGLPAVEQDGSGVDLGAKDDPGLFPQVLTAVEPGLAV